MAPDRAAILAAWLDTRWARARLRSRADVVRRQARLWERLAPALAQTPALAHLAGQPLEACPVVTPREIRGRFADWNTLGLDIAQAEAAAASAENGGDGEVAPGVSAGFSTGTSGHRGIFLASGAERARYLGQALAKLLPANGLLRSWRIALCLRADSALYREVAGAGRIAFRFFGLDMPPLARAEALAAFAPDILIAPSHVLAGLARLAEAGDFTPSPRWRLLYGAEPMGEAERGWIEAVLGGRPDPVYQATEGFLGAACIHGTLHLNEDSLVIERKPVAGTNRFNPIVTDLRRVSQPTVRVQLDDLLEPLEQPCPCRSPLAAVRGVEGRLGDLWRWPNVIIAPREVEAVVSEALGPSVDWRAVAGPTGVRLEAEGDGAPGLSALSNFLKARGAGVPVTPHPFAPQAGPKRRRVMWSDG